MVRECRNLGGSLMTNKVVTLLTIHVRIVGTPLAGIGREDMHYIWDVDNAGSNPAFQNPEGSSI